MAVRVRHEAEAGRFVAEVDGEAGHLTYEIAPGQVMLITHTFVPRQLRGRGIAADLVESALAHARERGLEVRPLCSYVIAHMARRRSRSPGPA